MNRHRFAGDVGGLCGYGWDGGAVCALSYPASLHYHDLEHPYEDNEDAGYCTWVLQNAETEAYCARDARDPVHVSGAPEVTVVMHYPRAEPPVPDGRLFGSSADAPAEDGGDGGAPWAYTPEHMSPQHDVFRCQRPDGVRDAAEAAASWEQQVATELETGGEVEAGPWPVRQFSFDDAGGRDRLWRVVGGLADTGASFTVDVWWVNNARRVARVQWGGFEQLSGVDIIERVAAWSPAG